MCRSPLEVYDFAEKGNINRHTYLIKSGRGSARREYLLQQINQQVFVQPHKVMAAMIAAIDAQARTWQPRRYARTTIGKQSRSCL